MESVSRRLEAAIRQVDRRLRESGGDDQQFALEAAREELNAILDEASYPRRAPSPSTSGLRSSARRLGNADSAQYHALHDEIRWVDEEASQARKELEDRLESRIVAIEAKMTAIIAFNNETDMRIRELERRSELQESVAKRNRLTMEELADKVSQVVSDLQARLLSVDEPDVSSSSVRSLGPVPVARESRPIRSTSRSDSMVRELMHRVETLESELEGERERSVRAVELVANALTPTRRTAAAISPDRNNTAASSGRRSSLAPRKLPMEEYAPRNGEGASGSKRYYQ